MRTLRTSLLWLCPYLALVGCAAQESSITGVVFPKKQSRLCTDLQDLRDNSKVALSEHVVISRETIVLLESSDDYVFTKPPFTLWPHLKLRLRTGDEMYYMEYRDPEAEFYESRWYFFRDGCSIAVIPWVIS